MALTVKSLAAPAIANFVTETLVTFDSSYLEGGEAFTPAQAGLISFAVDPICQVVVGTEEATVRAVTCYYETEKLHLIDSATGKEVASTKNMEKVKVRVWAFGKARAK